MAGGHSKLQPPSNGRHFQGGWDLCHHGGLGVHVHIPHRGQQTVTLGPLPPPPAAGPSGHGGVFIPWNGGLGCRPRCKQGSLLPLQLARNRGSRNLLESGRAATIPGVMSGTAVGAPSHGPLTILPKEADAGPRSVLPTAHTTQLLPPLTLALVVPKRLATVTTDRFLDVPAHRECPEAAKVQGGGDEPPQRQLNLPGREVPFKARAVRAPHRRHDERVLQYRVQGEASGVSNKDTFPAGLPPCQHDAPWLAISHFLEGGGGVLSRPPEKELPGGGDIHLEGEPKLALQPPNKLIGAGKVDMPDDPPHRDWSLRSRGTTLL
ncbi:hypothetical protein GWK47_038030 [Chionoecetes opilio]|uniref:Uncharacterized protein n=1 Tax=Chionoecetes opilio TaxID=41210 RepID=A0A8J4YD41_CHIOP|nr:hypothetical protein GWK47_038030 [Chionoecetes opilio]